MNKKSLNFTSIDKIKEEIDIQTSKEGIQSENPELTDMIDIDTWVKIQNNFANAINLPVFLIEESGTEIAVSKDFPYYCKLINSKTKGRSKCIQCRQQNFAALKEEGSNIRYFECHAGLFNIMTPIKINDKVVGAVNCSSILKSSRNIAKVIRVAEQNGIESVELIDAVNELQIKKREDMVFYGTLLFILSQTIPGLVNETKVHKERIDELEVINSFSNKIQKSLKLNDIIKIVLDQMMDITNAYDASIILYRENEDQVQLERYTYGSENLNFVRDAEKAIIKKIKEERTIHKLYIEDDIETQFGLKTTHIQRIGVMPLLMNQSIIGFIFLYMPDDSKFNKNTKELLEVVSTQISFGLTNAKQFEEINQLAITDKLTNLYNRRYIMEKIDEEMKRTKRNERSISVMLMDIDHFSNYNNTNGHPAGDYLLTEIARIIKESVREIDQVGRYGGEEIMVILPDANINDSLPVAERIRKAIESYPFKHREKQPLGKITTCIGLVSYNGQNKDSKDLIKMADELLYKSKEEGRNKTSYRVYNEKAAELINEN